MDSANGVLGCHRSTATATDCVIRYSLLLCWPLCQCGGEVISSPEKSKTWMLAELSNQQHLFYSCISRHSSLVSLHLRQLGRSLVEAIGQTRSGLVSITPVWPALIVGSATVQRYLDLILRASIEEPSSCRRCACVVAVSCPIYKARSAHSRWNFTSASSTVQRIGQPASWATGSCETGDKASSHAGSLGHLRSRIV